MNRYVKDPRRPVIGKGTYGVVYRVKCRLTNDEFALKCHIRNTKDSTSVEDSTVRELSSLAALRGHLNIIQLLDCFVDDRGAVSMLMPYVPYTLSSAIHKGNPCVWHGGIRERSGAEQKKSIPLSFVASFSSQTANALAHMHMLNLIHRDVTPKNVLLTEDLTVKVADMGLARQSSRRMSLGVVTEPYRAPELFGEGQEIIGEYTCAIDMWSLGAMIADAMEGKVVFSKSEIYSTIELIEGLVGEYPDQPEANASVAKNREKLIPNVMNCETVKGILFRLLAFDASKRLTANELLCDSEWMEFARMTNEEKTAVMEICKSGRDQ